MQSEQKTWIETTTGVKFSLLEPKSRDVRLWDIAVALSRIPRYVGHGSHAYSVALHSVYVSLLLEGTGLEREGLMHDATEAYINDISSPLKRLINEASKGFLDTVELRIWDAICERFDLCADALQSVKAADQQAFLAERRDLGFQVSIPSELHAAKAKISIYSEVGARDTFLARALQLGIA